MQRSNEERVLIVAQALGELCDKVVFVGGSVSQFYSDDSAAANPRPTEDVDCVVNLSTYAAYNRFCEELYKHKFFNDTSPSSPMCRFVYDEVNVVDIMPVDDTVIGESNSWYKAGFAMRKMYELSQGKVIYLMPVLYYVASKFEALLSRGGNDYRGAKDFEDIVYVVNSCSDLLKSLETCKDNDLLAFLEKSFSALLLRSNIDEEIECSLYEDGRLEYVKIVMSRFVSR